MKRKLVTRLLSGMITATIAASSFAPQVLAAEDDFTDILEESFEAEEDVEVEEDDTELELETEDTELVGISASRSSVNLVVGAWAYITIHTNNDETFTVSGDYNSSVVDLNWEGGREWNNGSTISMKAAGAGSTTVTVKSSGGETTKINVSVHDRVYVNGITLSERSLDMNIDDTPVVLTAYTQPSNADNKTVTWKVSDESVVSLSEVTTIDTTRRYVTPQGPGTATVTAISDDGHYEASCTVTVSGERIDITGLEMEKPTVYVEAGKTSQLNVLITPDNATHRTLKWTSSAPRVIAVNETTGQITASRAGEAEITAATQDGSLSATCKVIASYQFVDVQSVTLNKTEALLKRGAVEELSAVVAPESATDQDVVWRSNDPAVATVDADGKVTAVGDGKATITALAGNKTATCAITVTTPVEKITLEKDELELKAGDTVKVVSTVSPENASNKKLVWTSSNTSVATVSEDGTVKAVAPGKAIISASSSNETIFGNASASMIVEVSENAVATTGVSLDKTTLDLVIGDTYSLTASVRPENAANKTVTWNSSNPEVASVDESGKVTALKAGSASIEAATADNYTAHCMVSVSETATDPAENVVNEVKALPDPSEVTIENKEAIEKAKEDYEKLTEKQKNSLSEETIQKLLDLIAALEAISGDDTGVKFKLNEETGLWEYFVDGVHDTEEYGFVDYEGYKFIVANGAVAPVNGLVMDPNGDKWYFCAEGQAVKHTGLVMYNDEWFYVDEGVLDTGLNALVGYNGGLFYVAAGRITREVSGLVLDPNSPSWYFVAYGEVQNHYTGLAAYNNEWFYVENGRLAVEYSGTVEYDGQPFTVVNGMVQR